MTFLQHEGFELSTFRSTVRCTENANPENTGICENSKSQLTPQLTPDSRKENKTDTQNIPDDLAEIMAAWPELPVAIRSAIVAIVRDSKGQQ